MGAFTSLNLVVFYLFWELTLIPMFFLIGVWGGDRRKYAALKFIIFTFAGSAVMLLGFLALYFGVSPSTFDIPELVGKIPVGLQYLPLLAVFVGFAVELPVFPFHSWQPDAYEQAPAPVNSLLSGILPKFAGYAVIRIALGLFPQAAYQYAWAFIVVAVFSMFYGAVVALLQSDLKRMFAYTSISHMGFVLFGAFATVPPGNPLGIEGAILLMFTHALAAGSLFTLSGFVEKQSGTRKIPLLGGMGQARSPHGSAPRRREQRRDGHPSVRELPRGAHGDLRRNLRLRVDRGDRPGPGDHRGLLPLDAEAGHDRPAARRRRQGERGRRHLEGRRRRGRPLPRPAGPPHGLLLPHPLARRARRPVDRQPRSRRPALPDG